MSERHRIPVIDRMMDVLGHLEADGAAGIGAIVGASGIPRSTVYRILNTLEDHRVVQREAALGTYRLGPRLLSLARQVAAEVGPAALGVVARPHLERLVAATGECSKLSIVDAGETLVVEAVQSTHDYAIAVRVGRRLPLHAGAAGKVLLAWLPDAERASLLAGTLGGFTALTTTDPRRLADELATIRREGWAVDRGEHTTSIHAVAAPVLDHAGRAVAAVSIPYLATTDAARTALLHEAVVATARALSRELGAAPALTAPAGADRACP